jgi:hypothetical protein
LEITPYQAAPVFAQMWLITQDPEKLSATIPNRPGILVQYVLYLAQEKQFDAIPSIVERLTANVNGQKARDYGRDDVIGPMEDKLLLEGHGEAALEIWKNLCSARWLPYAAPTEGHPLTNGDFRMLFFGHGFDWATLNVTGATSTQTPGDGLMRFAFSGDEPDRVTLLRQFVVLEPRRTYRLDWQAEADGIPSPAGLHWHIYPVLPGWPQDLQSGDLLGSGPHWEFRLGESAAASMLALEYARPLGTTHATGTVRLRTVSLKEQDDMHEKK